MDEKDKDDLTSDDYIRVARLIAERLTSIIRLARERSMTPPFEMHVTGADDDVVMRASITNDGYFEDVAGFPEQPLSARFTLTATVSDAVGQTLELNNRSRPGKSAMTGNVELIELIARFTEYLSVEKGLALNTLKAQASSLR